MHGMTIHQIGQAVGLYVARRASGIGKPDILAYGAEILIGCVIKLCVLFLVASIFNIVLEVTILLLTTGIIRTLSGGAHCSAYYRCMITSVSILNVLGFAIQHFYPILAQIPSIIFIGINILSFCLYLNYAPQAPHNKPFESGEKEKAFRRYTLISVVMLSSLSVFWGSDSLIGWTIVLAILWQAFTLTPVGHSFIGLWDALLKFNRKGGELKC